MAQDLDPLDDHELAVRLPRQRRSRASWGRILEAGVALVEEGGYDAFTIAAVCERAAVPPRAVYERVNTKDGLFLAVYEKKMADVEADRDVLFDAAARIAVGASGSIRLAVGAMVGTFSAHEAFLRSVILISGVHPEINRRGSVLTRALGERFAALVLRARSEVRCVDPEEAVQMAFSTAFSALAIRTSYGADFSGPAVDDDSFVDHLASMIDSYLLRPAH
ncbi:hypothetical protein JCM9803A_02000 [Rhodococcus erythropolis]